MGKLGQIEAHALPVLAELLSLETVSVNEQDTGDTNHLTEMLSRSVFDIHEIDVEGALVYQVRHPAKAFLRTQKVHVVQGEEAMAHQEPLFLDNLTTYQIKAHLINGLASNANNSIDAESATDISSAAMQDSQILMYQKIIPAGVARQTTIPNQQQKLQQQCAAFKEQLIANGFDDTEDHSHGLQLLTPTTEYPVQIELAAVLTDADNERWYKLLPNMIKMKGSVPILVPIPAPTSMPIDGNDNKAHIQTDKSYAKQSPSHWLNILPNSASPKHLLKFWLSHLYWQVARRTTAEQVAVNDGVSIWRFNKPSSQVDAYDKVIAFKLSPILYNDAVIELIKWAVFANLSGQVPITLLPEYALSYLDKCAKVEESLSYWPKRADFSDWLRPSYFSDTLYDTCSQHAIWQYVLRDQDAFKALSASLTTLAQPLYAPMFATLETLDG